MMNSYVEAALFLISVVSTEYDFKCAFSGTQWKMRARKMCLTENKYMCLMNVLAGNKFEESCLGPDGSIIGSRLVLQPKPQLSECKNGRFQPFVFRTYGNSDCVNQHSKCSEEGQVVYKNGTNSSDIACHCDYIRGYTFIAKPESICFCVPSKEDCSCYNAGCTMPLNHACYYERDKVFLESRCNESNQYSVLQQNGGRNNTTINNIQHHNITKKTVAWTQLAIVVVLSLILLLLCVVGLASEFVVTPKVINRKDSYFVDYGKNVTIEWDVSSKLPFTCHFTKNIYGKEYEIIADKDSIKYVLSQSNPPFLIIKNADETDEGTFVCVATNAIGSTSSEPIKVNIWTVPKVTNRKDNYDVNLGENITIEWEVSSKLQFTCQFTKMIDGQKHDIKESIKYELKETDFPFLIIKNTSETDEGTFTCIATNRIGSTKSKPIKVNISKPSAAYKNMSEEDKKEFVKLLMNDQKVEKRYFFRTVIVGKNGSGKTCLRRRLLKETKDEIKTNKPVSTDGIEIDVQNVKIVVKNGQLHDRGDWIIDNRNTELDHRLAMIRSNKTNECSNTTEHEKSTMLSEIKDNGETKILIRDYSSRTQDKDKVVNVLKQEERKKTNLPRSDYCPTNADENIKPDAERNSGQQASKLTTESYNTEIVEPFSQNVKKDSKATTQDIKKQLDDELKTINCLIDVMDIEAPATNADIEYAFSKLWDFAGQKIFYATHQAFLTCSAIYILTVGFNDNLMTSDDDYHFEDSDNAGDYVNFWLDTIHCFCTSDEKNVVPSENIIAPPVIVVCTHTDAKQETDKKKNKSEEDFENNFVYSIKQNASREHIFKNIFFVSNTMDDDEVFKEIRCTISSVASKMKTWGEDLPQKWILLEKAIEILRCSNRNVVPLSIIYGCAENKNVGMHNKDQIKLFLRYYHEMGQLIYFERDEYVILNPEWLIDAFKCIVSHNIDHGIQFKCTEDWDRLTKFGILSESLATELLRKGAKHKFFDNKEHLLNTLNKFDIIIPIKDSRNSYCVPSMMKATKLQNLEKEVFGKCKQKWQKTSWLSLALTFVPPAFFQHILAFFMEIYCPNNISISKPDLYRGIGLFNIGESDHLPEKFVVRKSTNSIDIQGWVCTSKNIGFTGQFKRIRLQLEQAVLRIKKRYSLNIRYWTEFRCLHGATAKKLEEWANMHSENKIYSCNINSENHSTREIYETWYKHQAKDEHGYPKKGRCLKDNEKSRSIIDRFLYELIYNYQLTSELDVSKVRAAVCTCEAKLEQVWEGISLEQIAVAHEVYKNAYVFQGNTENEHAKLYLYLLENDLFLGDSVTSGDRMIYILYTILSKNKEQCQVKGNILDQIDKLTEQKDGRFGKDKVYHVLLRLLGGDTLFLLNQYTPKAYSVLMNQCDNVKLDIEKGLQKVTLILPHDLLSRYEDITGFPLEDIVHQSSFKGKVNIDKNVLTMDSSLFK